MYILSVVSIIIVFKPLLLRNFTFITEYLPVMAGKSLTRITSSFLSLLKRDFISVYGVLLKSNAKFVCHIIREYNEFDVNDFKIMSF